MFRIAAALILSGTLLGAELHSEIIVVGDGGEQVVVDGGQVTVNGRKMTVKMAPTNVFRGNLCEFRLGRQYSLEKDEDDDAHDQYTFDGTNVVFDVYELKAGTEAKRTVDLGIMSLALATKQLELKRKPSPPIEIGGAAIHGVEVPVTLAGIRQRHSFYIIPNGARAVVLKFQYTDDAVDLAEYQELVGSLRKTFRFIEPASGSPKGTMTP